MPKTRGGSETPKPRFCLCCEEVIVSTEMDFFRTGHVNSYEFAGKKYAMNKTMVDKIVAKLRSGAFGTQAKSLEIHN